MFRRSIAIVCLLLAAPIGVLAADCPTTLPRTGELIGRGLLDAATPDAERERLGKLLLCSAVAGNAVSQEIAGSLYRWGPRHPAHVFAEDHDRARDLLTAAAGHGRTSAMLKLAELELADGHAHEALVWTQVEGVFYRRLTNREDDGDSLVGAGYYTMLLKRAMDAVSSYDVNALQTEVDARVAALDRQIAAQPASTKNASRLGTPKIPPQQHVRNASPTELNQGAYAQYFVEIGPDGRARRSWMIDAYPDPGSGLRIGRVVPQIRWSEAPAGDQDMRYALVPVSMGSLRKTVHLQ